ncbi:MAG: alpha/beta hydrolase [Synergistaceae bacterium]|nr:alpha/beta hydrolase [Synergistaceae bacterium]
MVTIANNLTYYRPLILFLILALIVLALRLSLPRIVFVPSAEIIATPAALELPFDDVFFEASDGVRLNGWYIPAENARGTLLFFHGNAGNISYRLNSIDIFNKLGLSVFIVSYRGYGRSEGEPSIPGVTFDALGAWKWLTEEKKVPSEKIVVFGRSLGGAVAMELMRRVEPRALILESTFSSLPEMIKIPFMAPVARLVVGDIWNSAEAASELTAPTLCIHSPDDWIVPYSFGRRLYDAVASEKTFVQIRGGHNDGFLESLDVYLPALDAFLTKHFGLYDPAARDMYGD